MFAILPILLALAPADSPSQPAAGQAIVELYTMGEGTNLWERYGHAALCIRYQRDTKSPVPRGVGQSNRDACYNWGTFDFTKPAEMFWGILREKPVFWVSAKSPQSLLGAYRYFDRSIYRQVLPLTSAQVDELIVQLETSILPGNSAYVYHHLHNNCSTQIRDVIEGYFPGTLSSQKEKESYTFRDLAREGIAESRLTLVALDLFLGRGLDLHPSAYQASFLPKVLRDIVEEGIGIKPETIYQRTAPLPRTAPLSYRWIFLVLGLLIALPAIVSRITSKGVRIGMTVSVVLLLLLTSILWLLAIVSTLPEFRYNEVLLLFWPSDFLLLTKHKKKYALLRIFLIGTVFVLTAAGVLLQPLLPICFVPLFLLLLVATDKS